MHSPNVSSSLGPWGPKTFESPTKIALLGKLLCTPSCLGLQDTSALVRKAQLPSFSWRWAKTSFISHFLQMLWACWEVFLYHLKQLLPSNFQQTAFRLSWQFLNCRRAITTMTAHSTGGHKAPHQPHLVCGIPLLGTTLPLQHLQLKAQKNDPYLCISGESHRPATGAMSSSRKAFCRS